MGRDVGRLTDSGGGSVDHAGSTERNTEMLGFSFISPKVATVTLAAAMVYLLLIAWVI